VLPGCTIPTGICGVRLVGSAGDVVLDFGCVVEYRLRWLVDGG
jgi:hypothetical protein